MARQIIWTPQAREDYHNTVSYLLDVFGGKVAEEYTDRLTEVLTSIEMMPSMGRSHPELTAIQQVVMRPYTVICYLVSAEQITIINLLDSRTERRRKN